LANTLTNVLLSLLAAFVNRSLLIAPVMGTVCFKEAPRYAGDSTATEDF
jgi:hypothetical protein